MFEEYTEDVWSINDEGTEVIRKTYGEEPINRDFFENDQQWIDDENQEFGVKERRTQKEQKLDSIPEEEAPKEQQQELQDVPRSASAGPRVIQGMVFEHNDEELPEPDLEPDEFWPDSDYGSDQEDDIFGNEDSGPPSLTDQELRDLDRKAMVTEIDRLIAMQAVQRIALSEIQKQDGTGEAEYYAGRKCKVNLYLDSSEQFVHPQMFSYFKELGHLVQELCESHIPERNVEGPEEEESGKESEEGKEMAQAVKELKEIMAKQNECMQELKQDIAGMKEPVLQQSQLTALAIKELTKEVRDLQANFKELQGRWDEFIEEEEKAREEYAKYFEEQEKLKEEFRQERDRFLEKELRMEGHHGPRTSTSPTRKEVEEEDISQYNDRGYFDRKQEEEEAEEALEENENEYYTQADIAQKEAKRKEQEKGFKPPVDKSQEYKYYTEGGHIYRQSHKTGEKTWWNYDYKYKHQKGKGKEAYEKAGKGSRPHQPFQPRDEEDKAYWVKDFVREKDPSDETDKNYYAVYPYDGNDYQWKWNSENHHWYFFDLTERRWYKQEGIDPKGKDTCLMQEQKWRNFKGKGKGKKGKKSKDDDDEEMAKHSPEYYDIEAGKQKEKQEPESTKDTNFQ
ncbi:unnamed protein product [Symbiodinium sp. CCMP2456]|nr:unnamed protein product [Symbiodinium sp. CCMP2456]